MIKEIKEINKALNFICDTYFKTISNEDTLLGQRNFVNNYVYGKDTLELFNKKEFYYGYYKNKLVGVISLRNDGYIKFLFIDKDYQGMGIGKELMAFITNKALDNNLNYLTLDSSISNVLFYEKLGFVKIHDKICIDDIWFIPMKKCIKG